jgi:GNAT superfamily N-acetyltransferase
VSDPALDALAESARNRGLRLVRSRVRTPGKRRFGKVGLTDAGGKPVLGMDATGPTAKPEEVQDYLRNLGAKDWGASLSAADIRRKRKRKMPANKRPDDSRPEPRRAPPPPRSKPPPRPQIRDARPGDASALATLIGLLGHDVEEKGVRRRVSLLAKDRLAPLVATLGKEAVGLCGFDRMVAIHREQPVGRISILVVAEKARGQGIGRMLVKAAEDHLKRLGCGMVEITSNDRLAEAHAFYRHMGYERTSIRFVKRL